MLMNRTKPWLVLLAGAALACGSEADEGAGAAPAGPDAPGQPAGEPQEASLAPSAASSLPSAPVAALDPEASSDPQIPEDWRTYEDPVSGVAFAHPRDWIVRPAPGALVLEADDHQELDELITLAPLELGAAASPAAPEVRAALDEAVGEALPQLAFKRGPKPVEGLPFDAATYEYRGRLSEDRAGRYRAHVVVFGGRAASLALFADRATFRKRVETVEAILATFRPAARGAGRAADAERAPDLDPRVLGLFTRAGAAQDDPSSTYAFGGDGVVFRGTRNQLEALAAEDAAPVEAGTLMSGRWSSRGGVMRIVWSGGAMDAYSYGFESPDSFALRELLTGKVIDLYERLK